MGIQFRHHAGMTVRMLLICIGVALMILVCFFLMRNCWINAAYSHPSASRSRHCRVLSDVRPSEGLHETRGVLMLTSGRTA